VSRRDRPGAERPRWGRAARLVAGWVVLLAAAAVVGVPVALGEAVEQPEPDEVARGGALYAMYCAACHGARGEGGHLPGILAGPPVNDIDVAFADLVIRTGRMPIVSRQAGIMHDPDLGDDDRDQIVAWMAETFDLEGEVPDVPTGDPGHGRVLFNEHCAACHSTTGKGGVAGGGVTILPARDVDRVATFSAARVGPFGMPRFSEAVLSDEDLADIGTAIEEMDRERPSPLAITDVTQVSGTVYAAAATLDLLGLVGLIAKFPRITPLGDEPGPPDEGEKDPT
jgi:ubiquinol-cytochrome c reductase cytochrome c subunit